MEQIAVVASGDTVTFKRYYTEGPHYFFENGEEGTEERVEAVPIQAAIRPVVMSDLGQLIDPEAGGRIYRMMARRAYESAARRGVAMRFFYRVDGAFVEVPIGNIATRWTDFLAEVASMTIEVDEETDQVYLANDELQGTITEVEDREGHRVPVVRSITTIDAMKQEFKGLGCPPEVTERFLQHFLRHFRASHNSHIIHSGALDLLRPRPETFGMTIAAAALGFVLGLDIAANNTFIADTWAGRGGGWLVPAILVGAGLLFWWIWRRNRREEVS